NATQDPRHLDCSWPTSRRLSLGLLECDHHSRPHLATLWRGVPSPLYLKRCTRSLSKPRSYEETMCCRFDPAPRPMPAEATYLAPPGCVSTHRSRVVDPDRPTPFL